MTRGTAERRLGTAPCNVAPGSGITKDIIGIDIRVDGDSFRSSPRPPKTGLAPNPTSLQTGPYDGSNSFTNLCWAHLKVVLDTNRQLSVFWKGTEILSNYQTAYFPSAGQLVFAGRTGGSWQNQQLDNLKITTTPRRSGAGRSSDRAAFGVQRDHHGFWQQRGRHDQSRDLDLGRHSSDADFGDQERCSYDRDLQRIPDPVRRRINA